MYLFNYQLKMKKTLIAVAYLLLIVQNMGAQSCLPNGITFTSQADINNFPASYPGVER